MKKIKPIEAASEQTAVSEQIGVNLTSEGELIIKDMRHDKYLHTAARKKRKDLWRKKWKRKAFPSSWGEEAPKVKEQKSHMKTPRKKETYRGYRMNEAKHSWFHKKG